MPVAAALGNVDRPLAAGVLERPPRSHLDQPLCYLNRGTAVGSLVQRGVK
jgi:hypothetical protein